jgi:hypothetical protein
MHALARITSGAPDHPSEIERGSFLLIIAGPPGKPPMVRFVHAFPKRQFGILAVRPGVTINVFHCLECNNFTRFGVEQDEEALRSALADRRVIAPHGYRDALAMLISSRRTPPPPSARGR